MELDKIPGYKEALAAAEAQEEALRDVAFIDVELDICGVPVRQFTPRHLLLCFYTRSPFFFAGDTAAEHVAQFLWLVSPRYTAADPGAREAFVAEIVTINFETAVEAIHEYLDAVFMDRPAANGPARSAITSFVANLVDEFAAEYGWSREAILDTPLAALYQLLRRIERRRDPKAVFFSRLSDKARREVVNLWRASQKAKATKKPPAKLKGGNR